MTSEDKPGLKIRRRPADEGTDSPEANTDATVGGASPAPVDPYGTTEPIRVVPEPEPAAPEAPAAVAPPTPEPEPAEPAPVVVGGTATPDDTRRSKAWRSDVVAPPAHDPEPARKPAPIARRDDPPPTTDEFAAMLGESTVRVRTVEVGEKVSAPIVAIGTDAVFVALGGKAEGAIDRSELSDDEGNLRVKLGDLVEAYVVSVRDGIKLSRGLHKGSDHQQMLEDAQAQHIPVEGRVTGTNKGGYEVQVLGARAFCPFSQMDTDPTTQPEQHVGATYTFLVTRVEEDGRNVVVSRRALIEQERAAKAETTLGRLHSGAEFEGTVTRVADFGAFVDIGGVDGLVHVSEMSYARLDHPSEMVRVGDVVRVAVLGASDLGDPKNRRIALSMKALQEDPWVAGVRELKIGDTVPGRVARMESFGAFVEIGHGLDGLVHISEISPGRRINHPREVLSVGQDIQVQIVRIDPARRQIALSIKALMDDPWSLAAREMPVGSTVQGTVDSVQSFGVFVALPSGINGLLPMSQLPDDEARNVHNRFRSGTPVEARVLAVDPGRQRLTLTRRDDSEGDERAAFESYRAGGAAAGGLGTLADLLKKKGG